MKMSPKGDGSLYFQKGFVQGTYLKFFILFKKTQGRHLEFFIFFSKFLKNIKI